VTPADILQPLSVPRRVPEPPFAPKDFHIVFDYGDDRLVYQSAELPLERASLLAIAAQAREVRITGYADTAGVQASGQRLREPLALARARAEMAAEALRRLGVPAQRLKLAWRGDPAPLAEAGAMGEPGRRRVTITVSP
jgi:outer membrane protein OmpA-like peptidoglycan-associated protein